MRAKSKAIRKAAWAKRDKRFAKEVAEVAKAKRENKRYPGKLNYTGPDKGWFAFVHHGKLFEHTRADGDSIEERVHYVLNHKPKDERAIRIDHIMYLGATLSRKLTQIMNASCNNFRYNSLHRNAEAAALVEKYIAKHKPKNMWRSEGLGYGTLMKANGHPMTG